MRHFTWVDKETVMIDIFGQIVLIFTCLAPQLSILSIT